MESKNWKKNQRKHANKKIKQNEYIIRVCGSLENYYRELSFLSAYGFEARPTMLPYNLIPKNLLDG
jgi:hypothetical protein